MSHLVTYMGGYKMDNRNYRWSNKQIRNHVEVLDEEKNPHIILKNATYLNTYLHQWLVANIWIYEDRIVYVGENLPENLNGYEVIDCQGQYLGNPNGNPLPFIGEMKVRSDTE